MKKIVLFFGLIGLFASLRAQSSGNAVYNQHLGNASRPGGVPAPEHLIQPVMQGSDYNQLVIKVQGLYNEVATRQVAIFNLTQVGRTTAEVNALIDEKIARIRAGVDSLRSRTDFFVDMVSFVPVYEYEKEKKIFSKKTYNEIPKGFEVQKNLHIGFEDGDLLNAIVAICAENEVYDLVRVGYVSSRSEAIRDSLREHAFRHYSAILAHHQRIHNIDYSHLRKSVNEGFEVSYPLESYRSYQAYNAADLDAGKNARVREAEHKTTLYYLPAYFDQHEFVVNPEVIEPTIQLVYLLEVRIDLNSGPKPAPAPVAKPEKEILFLTPQGELKRIDR